MENETEVKWAIWHICESIQKRSGIAFTAKEAARQILHELITFGHDLTMRDSGKQAPVDSRFDNWITRFHVSHRFKVMMNMNGVSYNRGRLK